jgi:ribonuclease P protein component
LQSAKDIERVWREGRSHAHPLAVLITCPRAGTIDGSPLPTRCAFVAGKRVGSAVARNRAKRLLREAFRSRPEASTMGWELVFVARQALAKATLSEVKLAVGQLLKHADVVH